MLLHFHPSFRLTFAVIGFFALTFLPDAAAQTTAAEWAEAGRLARLDYARQVICYTQALRKEPQNHAYLTARGDALTMQHRYAEAKTDFDAALKIDPDYPWALVRRATVQRELGQYASALVDLQHAVEVGTDDHEAYCQMAETYLAAKAADRAAAAAQKAIELKPDNLRGWNQLLHVCQVQHQPSKILRVAAQILLINPRHAPAYAAQGAIYAQQRDTSRAVAAFEKAVSCAPNDYLSMLALGDTRVAQHRCKEAFDWYDRASRAHPGDADILRRRKQAEQCKSQSRQVPERKVSSLAEHGGGCLLDTKPALPNSYEEYLEKLYGTMTVAARVDLSYFIDRIADQGKQGSCVAQTLAYLKKFQEKQETKRFRDFSASFIYNQLNEGRDSGLYVEGALRFLQEHGTCLASTMSYSAADFKTQPTESAFHEALTFRIASFQRLYSLKEVKYQLGMRNVVVGSFNLDEDFCDLGSDEIWNKVGERIPGQRYGHAMLIVGFDDERRAVKVVNSWGLRWSSNGFAWISYDIFNRVQTGLFIAKDMPNYTDSLKTIDTTLTPSFPKLPETKPYLPKPETSVWRVALLLLGIWLLKRNWRSTNHE